MRSAQHENLAASLLGESSFGPVAKNISGQRFDFTLLFEQSILAIGPSALMLLILPLRLFQLSCQHRKVMQSRRLFCKLSAYFVFGVLQVALLAQWAAIGGSSPARSISIAACTFGVLDAFALSVLSYEEHNRSVRPSSVISVYLLFSITFDAVQCRTLWLLGSAETVASVFTAMLASKLAILFFEVHEKRSILLQACKSLGPESTSGIINRGLFWWLNNLLMRGFSASLSLRTLWDTDEQLRSHLLLQRIQSQWGRRKNNGRHALFWSILHCLKGPLVLCIFPRLSLMAFKFSQPFFLKRVITYVEEYQSSDSKNTGYGLIAASGLIYTGLALSTGFYQHKVFRCLTATRGLLISLILTDTVKLNTFSTAGSGTLTFITSDVDRICTAFESFHEIWANIAELGLAIWLLQQQLGVGCLGPVAIVTVCMIATGQISRFMGSAIKAWNAAIQERVSVTSNILGSIKETKMLGMVEPWIDVIQSLRVQELKLSAKFRTLMMWMNVLGNTPSKMAPVATFGIAILASKHGIDQRLSTSTAFASLTIMNLIVGPLALLLHAVPNFVSSIGCFERIQIFLNEVDSPGSGDGTDIALDRDCVESHYDNMELREKPAQDSDTDVITARHANFAIKPDDKWILQDIDINIEPRSLTIVVGRVASGKTMLLRGILGELHTEGFLRTSATGAAYCAQTAWLVNSTIRCNILCQSPFEEEWYERVISACALEKDFSQLELGDLSHIGSKGIALSGGQKQRVSLARAIYSRKPVMVIDDVLGGLDSVTRSHIWAQVFGPMGLLRQGGTTVILATHTLDYIQDADKIVVLGDNGRLACQGNFSSIKNSSLVAPLLSSQDDRQVPGANTTEERDAQRQDNSAIPLQDLDEPDMTAISGSGDGSLYRYYLRSIGWTYGIPLLAVLICHALMGVLSDIWLRLWTDANKSDDEVDTGKYFGVYALIAIMTLSAIGLDTWFMFVKVIPQSGRYLHFKLLQIIMKAPLPVFTSTDSGDLINRFSKDMTLVDRDLPSNFWQCVGAALSTVASAGLVLQGASYLGAIVPLSLVFIYFLQKFYLRTSRQLRFLDLQASAPLYTHLLETVEGLSTIRAFGWQSATKEVSLKLLDCSQKPHYLLFCIQRWLTLVLDLFIAAVALILVTFGVVTPTMTSPGSIALALVNIIGLSQVLTHVISTWTTLETSLGAISRLKSFERETPQEITPEHPITLPAIWPASGELRVRDIIATYSTSAHTAPVLNGITFDAQPREKVAICGRTGSGKSSLLLTLFRILEVDSGVISIDGVNIYDIPQNILRQRLVSVPQVATLFPGSLRLNLCGGKSADVSLEIRDTKVISVLTKVGLWTAISLRGGLDTDMKDLVLSHGQKQLLCLARAVLRKDSSTIVILDEAMSAVDEHTKEVMMEVIDTEFSNHTVISIEHRLQSVLKFDKIVLLDGGRVIETGNPTQLLEEAESNFRALFEGRS